LGRHDPVGQPPIQFGQGDPLPSPCASAQGSPGTICCADHLMSIDGKAERMIQPPICLMPPVCPIPMSAQCQCLPNANV